MNFVDELYFSGKRPLPMYRILLKSTLALIYIVRVFEILTRTILFPNCTRNRAEKHFIRASESNCNSSRSMNEQQPVYNWRYLLARGKVEQSNCMHVCLMVFCQPLNAIFTKILENTYNSYLFISCIIILTHCHCSKRTIHCSYNMAINIATVA